MFEKDMNTYIARAPWDDVRPEPVRGMAHGPPERDPRRTHDHHLAPDGVHVLVLDASKGARAQAGARDDGVDRLCVRTAAPEEPWAALDDL